MEARRTLQELARQRGLVQSSDTLAQLQPDEEGKKCNQCFEDIPRGEYQNHQKYECQARLKFCDHCNQEYPIVLFDDHVLVCQENQELQEGSVQAMGRNVVIGEEAKQEDQKDSIECPKCSSQVLRAEFDDHFFAHQFEEESSADQPQNNSGSQNRQQNSQEGVREQRGSIPEIRHIQPNSNNISVRLSQRNGNNPPQQTVVINQSGNQGPNGFNQISWTFSSSSNNPGAQQIRISQSNSGNDPYQQIQMNQQFQNNLNQLNQLNYMQMQNQRQQQMLAQNRNGNRMSHQNFQMMDGEENIESDEHVPQQQMFQEQAFVPQFVDFPSSEIDEQRNHPQLQSIFQFLNARAMQNQQLIQRQNFQNVQQLKDTLPTFKFKKSNYENNGEQDSDKLECRICMCEFEDDQDMRQLLCFHHYHTECIDKWFESSNKCPLCKSEQRVN